MFNIKTLFKKKQEEVQEEVAEPIDSSLILIMEEPKVGIVKYFKDMGCEISNIYYNTEIEEAQYALMDISEYHRRIVIVESGAGIFTKDSNIGALVDIISLVNNISIDATVFYTNSTVINKVKKDIKTSAKKLDIDVPEVDFVEYESMVGVFNKLQSYNEKYIVGGAKDTVLEDPLNIQLDKVIEVKAIRNAEYNDKEIIERMRNQESEKESLIPAFKVRI